MKQMTHEQYRAVLFWLGYAMARAANADDKQAIISLVQDIQKENE